MTAKTMAEVLAEHRMSPQDYAYCICGDELSPEEDGGWTTHEVMEAHQAAALSAAGFGFVADAKAEAWDHGHHDGAVDQMLHMENGGAKTTPNPYRAAS